MEVHEQYEKVKVILVLVCCQSLPASSLLHLNNGHSMWLLLGANKRWKDVKIFSISMSLFLLKGFTEQGFFSFRCLKQGCLMPKQPVFFWELFACDTRYKYSQKVCFELRFLGPLVPQFLFCCFWKLVLSFMCLFIRDYAVSSIQEEFGPLTWAERY